MRNNLLILLLILAVGGCLEERLSPSEAQMCLLSTRVQPSLLPVCKTALECEKELVEFFPAKTYEHVPAGLENIRARKGVAGAWSAIQRASHTLEQIRQSCTTLKAGDLLARAVVSASELQNVLKTTEEAQEFTYRALEKIIAYGAVLELERVKDTKAFETYATLLQNGHELQTQNPTSEWSQKQKDNQTYFEQVSQVLTQNKAGTYRVEWSSVFDAYRTGVAVAAPENARILLAVSPLWQGALGAFLGKRSSSNALGIVTQIRANEVIMHAEQVVAPENGLVIQTWKNIKEFDAEVSALYEYEKEMENGASSAITETRWHAEENEIINGKWIEVQESMRGWLETNEFSAAEEEYWDTQEEWIRLQAENDALRISRVNETKKIGQRVAERRELNRKIEDAKQKMSQNEEKTNVLRKQCESFLEKNNILTNGDILDAENCLNKLNEAKQRAIEKTDAGKSAHRAELNACVRSLNEVERALEEEETRVEELEYYFESGAVNACESARMNRILEYENTPLVREWNEKKEKMWALSNAILRTGAVWDWDGEKVARERAERAVKLTRDEKPARESVLRERAADAGRVVGELENSVSEIVDEAGNRIAWRVTSPQIIHADEEESFETEGVIESVWGDEIDFSFVTGATNPGVHTVSTETNGIFTQVVGNEWIIEGEFLPGEKIVLKGEGNGILAQLNEESTLVKMAGERATVAEHKELVTHFAPATIRVAWGAPAGIVEESISIWADGKRLPTQEGIENGFEIVTSAPRTKIRIAYEVEHAITVETRVKNQIEEWGRAFVEYEVAARNGLPHEVSAAIFTGVSGDPLLTQTIRVTNENGENVPHTLDAMGNVVLSKQVIEGGGTREYRIFVERNEGMEDWISLGERLRLDIEALIRAENNDVVLGAFKLKNKLNTLQKEKDTAKLAEKLIEIQMEASSLWLREEEYQNEWSALQNEWNSLERVTNNEMEKWLAQGNAALSSRNKQKLLEAMQKIKESKKSESENAIIANLDEEKIMEAAKRIMAQAQANAEAYEKALSIGCEKLLLVNFVCPIEESEFKNVKKKLNADKKTLDKMNAVWMKIKPDARGEERGKTEKEWVRLESETEVANKMLEDGLRVLRNAAVERTAALERETKGSGDEDIISSVEKATLNVENGEFGKSIFVAQSVLNYVNGNKMTGLFSIPILAWPFVGIIVIIGGWMVWKEREKKKVAVVPVKMVPRGNTFTPTETNISAPERPPKQEEPQLGGIRRGAQYIQVRPETLAHSEKETLRRAKNPKTLRRKEEPRSPKGG